MREAPQTAAALTRGGGGSGWLPAYQIMSHERERRERAQERQFTEANTLQVAADESVDKQVASVLAEEGITAPEYSSGTRAFAFEMKRAYTDKLKNIPKGTDPNTLRFTWTSEEIQRLREIARRERGTAVTETGEEARRLEGAGVTAPLVAPTGAPPETAIPPPVPYRQGVEETLESQRRFQAGREEPPRGPSRGAVMPGGWQGRPVPGVQPPPPALDVPQVTAPPSRPSAAEALVATRRPIAPEKIPGRLRELYEVRTHAGEARKAEAEASLKEVEVPAAKEAVELGLREKRAAVTTAEVQAEYAKGEAESKKRINELTERERNLMIDVRRAELARDPLERQRLQLSIDAERQRIQIDKARLDEDTRVRNAVARLHVAIAKNDPKARIEALIDINPTNAIHLMDATSRLHERAVAMNERAAEHYRQMSADKTLANIEPRVMQINRDRLSLALDEYAYDPRREPMVLVEVITPIPRIFGAPNRGERSSAPIPLFVAEAYISGDLLNQARTEGERGAEALANHMQVQFGPMTTEDAIALAERYYSERGVPETNVLNAITKFRRAREGVKQPAAGTIRVPLAGEYPAGPRPTGPTIPQVVGEAVRRPVPEFYAPTPGYGP